MKLIARKSWIPRRLNELGFVGRGRSRNRPRNDPTLYGGPYPFIQTADIMASDLRVTKYSQTYSEKGLAQSKLWGENTLCMTIAGENTAETAILSFKACFPDSIVGFVADSNKADVRFVKYYLDTIKQQLKSVSKGATQDNLSLDKLLSFDILTPPVTTQCKIASILSAYDDLIENNTRRIAILEEMAQSLYREWFVHFRFPGHEKKRLVDSELGLIPEGWEVKQLSEVCSRITDGSHWSPKTVDFGYPMASVKDMHDWGFNIEQCRTIAKEDYETLIRNDCKPLNGDVLIAKDGSYLKHIFVVEKELDIVILSSIAILRPNNKILPYVLSFYLHEPLNKSRLKSFVSGVAIPRIVLKDFAKFLVLLPSRELQEQFCKLAESMIVHCYRLIEKNTNLRQTRDLLLPKLISGEVDVEGLSIAVGK